MKKNFLYLVTIVSVIVFTACSGSTKSDTPAKEPVKVDTVKTVAAPEPVAPTPTLTPAEMLKSFQDYAKAYGEAFNNIAKSPQKYSELAGQSQKRVNDMEQIKSQLTKKQLQDYQKALDIILKVNSVGKKK